MHPFFLYLKYPGHDPGVWWLKFLLLLGADWGCGAGCMAGAGPGFSCVVFCLQIMMKIKTLNSIKTKSSPSFCRKSLWCTAGIFAVTNDDLWQPEGVYIVWVQSWLSILTPGINQSSQVGWENAPVLSICQHGLLGLDTACLFGVYGL